MNDFSPEAWSAEAQAILGGKPFVPRERKKVIRSCGFKGRYASIPMVVERGHDHDYGDYEITYRFGVGTEEVWE